MATNRAIAATSTAIVSLLSAEYQRDPQLPQCTVSLFQAEQFQKPPEGNVIGVYLYRVGLSDVQTNTGRPVPGGPRLVSSITIDLHYLVAALAADAATSQRLLGWAISVFSENPLLGSSALNTLLDTEPVFEDGEAVALVWEPLPLSDLYDVWQVAARQVAPSATYVARGVQIDPWAVTRR